MPGGATPNLSALIEADYPLNSGSVAWWLAIPHWTGGNSWRDLVGNNHGNLTGMTATTGWRGTTRPGGWAEVKFGGAQRVLTPSPVSHKIGTGDFTIAAWVNLASTAAGYTNAIFSVGTYAPSLYGALTGSEFGLFLATDCPSGKVLVANRWTHLVVSRKSGSVASYADGRRTPTTTTNNGSIADAAVTIGADSAGGGSPMNAGADDIRLWSRAFTDTEVGELFEASSSGYRRGLRQVSSRITFAPAQSGSTEIQGDAALVGGGTLGASGVAIHAGDANLTGTSALAAAGAAVYAASASLAGIPALTAGGSAVLAGSATLVGVGVLTANGGPAADESLMNRRASSLAMLGPSLRHAPLPVGGVEQGDRQHLAGVSRAVLASTAATGTASLVASGTLAAAGVASSSAVAALTGAGMLAVAGRVTATGSAALTSQASLIAAGTASQTAAAALIGTATLVAAGTASSTGTAALSGGGELAAAGVALYQASAVLAGGGVLAAAGVAAVEGSGSVDLIGPGTLVATGTASYAAAVGLVGGGSLTANGTGPSPPIAVLATVYHRRRRAG